MSAWYRPQDRACNINRSGLITGAAAVAWGTAAAADPPPPVPGPRSPGSRHHRRDPVPIVGAPSGPNGLSVLGQSGTRTARSPRCPTGPRPGYSTLLGQLPLPRLREPVPAHRRISMCSTTGTGCSRAWTAAPGEGQQFDVASGQENADVNRREWLGRYIDMYRAGMLKGGLLGQSPQNNSVSRYRALRLRREPTFRRGWLSFRPGPPPAAPGA